jgi:hypothetical protein
MVVDLIDFQLPEHAATGNQRRLKRMQRLMSSGQI